MPAEIIAQKANPNKWLLIVSIVLTGFIVLLGFIIILILLNNYMQKEQSPAAERTKSHLLKQTTVSAMSTDTQKIVSIIEPINVGDLQAMAKPKPMPDVITEIPAIMLNNEPTEQEKKQALTAALAEYNSKMQNVAVVDKVIVVPDITDSNKTPRGRPQNVSDNKSRNNHTQKINKIYHDKPKETLVENANNATNVLTKTATAKLNRSQHIKLAAVLNNKISRSKPRGIADNKLLNANKQFYTIQLLGSHSEQAIRHFINTHKISSQVNYFKTQLNGKNWYVLVYGHYFSKNKALTAITKLPNTLRQLQPWPRRFADIK